MTVSKLLVAKNTDDFVASKIAELLEKFWRFERKMPRLTACMSEEIEALFESADYRADDYADGLRAAQTVASELAQVLTEFSSLASSISTDIEKLS